MSSLACTHDTRGLVFFLLACVAAMPNLCACARTHLYYDATERHHSTLKGHQKDELQALLADRLKDRKVTRYDQDGRMRATATTRQGLGALDIAELGALRLATEKADVGGESDMRIRTDRGAVPVTVKIALDGTIELHSGGRTADPNEGPLLSESEIRARFGLQTTLPGAWDAAERRALAMALALLSPRELDVVRGISFERRPASRHRPQENAALYRLQGCRGAIEVYSSGVRSDRFRFMGDPAAPRHAVLHSILHEFGHAIAMDAARDAYCAAARTSGAQRNTFIDKGNTLVRNSPVIAAYLRVKGDGRGPTDYGDTSADESFAESFALFHVDPAALKRVLPRVHAWFADGTLERGLH